MNDPENIPEKIDAAEAYEAIQELNPEDGFEMPQLGNKNCNWCWGRGFAYINKQVGICKCMRPKTEEEKESQIGRLQQAKLGKHVKGRSMLFGRRGTWKEVPLRLDEMTDEQKVSSSEFPLKWRFFYAK